MSLTERRRALREWAREHPDGRWGPALDATALVVVAVLVVWLLPDDGGFATLGLRSVAWLFVLASPLAWIEARRLPAASSWLLAAFALGLVLSVGLGQIKYAAADPLSVYAAMVLAGLAGARLWRLLPTRRLLVWVVSGSLLLAWVLGVVVWLGAAGTPRWLVVSWHNQSAAFMAAGAVWFGALATTEARGKGLLAAVASGLSLTAVLLTGSRGGLLVAVVGVVLLVGARHRNWPRWGVLAVAAVVGAFLLSLSFPNEASPLEARGEGTAQLNAVARFGHWEAGMGMFLDDPITGWGVGSYGVVAPEFNDAGVNLTASAHNEFVELFAEGGLLVGVPAVALAAAAALTGIRALGRGSRPDQLGMGLIVLVLGAHALIDFDWLYPSLACLFAIAAGTLPGGVGERSRLSAMAPTLLVVVGAGLVWVSGSGWLSPLPWSPRPPIEAALEAGPADPASARDLLAPVLSWNPGDDVAVSLDLAYGYLLGDVSGAEVLDALEVPRTRFGTYALLGRQLAAAGDPEMAALVLDEAIVALPAYVRWGPATVARSIWEVRLQAAYLAGGCPDYREQVERLMADPSFDLYGFALDASEGLNAECG